MTTGSTHSAALLLVDRVSKDFPSGETSLRALQTVSFLLAAGEFVCLVGPSGSGKSTLLRIVGGLLAPDTGTVWFQNAELHEPHADIGFVFQTTNLMPWRTVLDNLLLPVEVRQGATTAADRRSAQELLALVGLAGFEQAWPKQLSGGMRQRVVLARTLLQQPQLLLMDEPFGALDALTRERLNLELLQLHQRQGMTVFMVTHSIPEAVLLADRVLVMSERPGRILAEVVIDLPRPRHLAQMGGEPFGRLSMQVRRWIGETI